MVMPHGIVFFLLIDEIFGKKINTPITLVHILDS